MKRIILLSDGTGNSAAKVWRTNVWRTFEFVDLTQPDQVAIYDDGVGTSSFKPAAILGGAFGFGLKRNVLSLYKFLSRNYKSKTEYQNDGIVSDDDEIFAFGFSRGAFTIRVLIGLVLEQGLVRAESELEFDRKAKAAYRAYRRNFKTRTGVERPFRGLRDLWFWLFRRLTGRAAQPRDHVRVERIRFLGLWDTVAAYGLPVDEMTYGISRYVWPLELPNRQLDTSRVQRACHALSLDDERTTFHPVLWDESDLWEHGELPVQPDASGNRLTMSEKISQVWFAGVHTNVGGGYPDDSLAHVSLNWMLDQAKDCGLRFKTAPDALTNLRSQQDSDGRLYDFRSGLGGYYRYGPRSVTDLSNPGLYDDRRDRVSIPLVKIHESVLSRMKVNAHIYAPIALPEKYEIVTRDSKIVAPDSIKPTPNARPKYETSATAQDRYRRQEEIAWSTVWRRRIIYFLTVIASVHLAIYPLVSTIPAAEELRTRLRFVSDIIRLVGWFLPSNRWIDAYARNPLWFLVSAGAVVGLIWISSRLKSRITDEMEAAWDKSLDREPRIRTAAMPARASFAASHWPVLIALAAVALCLPLIVFYPAISAHLPSSVNSLLRRLSDGLVFFLAAASFVALALPSRWIASFRVRTGYKRAIQYIKRRLAPFAFAVASVLLGIIFGNHYLANILDSFGHYCPAESAKPIAIGEAPVVIDFDTGKLCTSVGIKVEKTGQYKLIVEQNGSWSFAGAPSSTAGMPLAEFLPKGRPGEDSALKSYGRATLMFLMYPLRRTLDRPWGRVIVRYGSTGNEEDFIDPGNETNKARREENLEPKRDGELFIYLNKPLFAPWPDLFGDFNSGRARVTVVQIPKK